jgi:hypothetical protein
MRTGIPLGCARVSRNLMRPRAHAAISKKRCWSRPSPLGTSTLAYAPCARAPRRHDDQMSSTLVSNTFVAVENIGATVVRGTGDSPRLQPGAGRLNCHRTEGPEGHKTAIIARVARNTNNVAHFVSFHTEGAAGSSPAAHTTLKTLARTHKSYAKGRVCIHSEEKYFTLAILRVFVPSDGVIAVTRR